VLVVLIAGRISELQRAHPRGQDQAGLSSTAPGNLDAALERLRARLAKAPRDAEAHVQLGHVLLKRARTPDDRVKALSLGHSTSQRERRGLGGAAAGGSTVPGHSFARPAERTVAQADKVPGTVDL
jgi:hypothetical protein